MSVNILFLCGREINYQRNRIILNSLKANNYNITVLEDRSNTKSILKRSSNIGLQLVKVLSRNNFDYIFIGFYGYLLIHLVKSLSKIPILFDPFVSNYETFIEDRKLSPQFSPLALASYQLDKSSLHIATHNLSDTNVHADYFSKTFAINRQKFSRFYVSCDEEIFQPDKDVNEGNYVLFYGTFQPLHGVRTIIEAASLLKDDSNVEFRIIGDGKEKSKLKQFARELGASNIHFQSSQPITVLPKIISESKVCLGGPFGSSEKAKRVITGKTFQSIALGKPTIVGENSATAEFLEHGKDAWFCKMDNPTELAESIKYLLANEKLRVEMGRNAYQTFKEKASLNVLAGQIKKIVEEKV